MYHKGDGHSGSTSVALCFVKNMLNVSIFSWPIFLMSQLCNIRSDLISNITNVCDIRSDLFYNRMSQKLCNSRSYPKCNGIAKEMPLEHMGSCISYKNAMYTILT